MVHMDYCPYYNSYEAYMMTHILHMQPRLSMVQELILSHLYSKGKAKV